ncbi:hypothetical protein V8G54_032321 [Vigna mungo]|uniref:Uncharacterized protein n=1 Tax=Vigna mungo TaxID=3915 RepID=A0AAQ3MLY7_VIGMU
MIILNILCVGNVGRKKDERLRVIVLETEHRSEKNRTQKGMATQTQDSPSNPNPNPNATSPTPSSSLFFRGAGASAAPVAGSGESHSHHRRALSEVSYRLPDDMMDLSPSDPFNGGSSTASLEEIGSEDDLFSTYIDVEKLGSGANGAGRGGNGSDQSGYGNGAGTSGHNDGEKSPRAAEARPRHRHSSSVDGSSSTSMFGEIMEAKKAMPPDKLAELWNIDPKRAKRSLLSSFTLNFSEFVFLKNAYSFRF